MTQSVNNLIDIDTSKPFEDKTIKLTKGENLTIRFNYNIPKNYNIGDFYSVTTNGKDLIYTFYNDFNVTKDENDNFVENKNAKLGSVTIKGFVSKNVVGNNGSITIELHDTANNKTITKEISSTEDMLMAYDTIFNNGWVKTGKLNGTRLSEYLDAKNYEGIGKNQGKGVTINAGGGNDTIWGSKYNDTIKAVSGTNTIIGDAGNDKLYAGKGTDTFMFAEGHGKDIVYSSNKSDSLVIGKYEDNNFVPYTAPSKLSYTKSGNNLVINYGANDSITLANYFKQKEGTALDTINQFISISNNARIHTSNGTYLNDNITGTAKADKISTGKGNDIITAGLGNDTITVNGAGIKTINIGENDGNDTINMTKHADLKINYTDSIIGTEYIRKGNNLIISNEYEGADKSQTTTIKNYFKYGDSLTVDKKSITNNDIINYVTGSTKNTKYNLDNYKDYASVVVTDTKGNDIYNINEFAKDIVINDRAGKDTLNILGMKSDEITLFFNVDKDGNKSGSLKLGSTIDKQTGSIEIVDYFGKGKIETITTTENKYVTGTFNIDAKIADIASEVQQWLVKNDYTDVATALENETNVSSLLAIYQGTTSDTAVTV